MNLDYHKKWSEEYKKVKGVFAYPSQIFEFLLNYQKYGFFGFEVPSFSYKITEKKEFYFNYYLYCENKEILVGQNNFSLKLNAYEKFLFFTLSFFRRAKTRFDDYFTFLASTLSLRKLFYEESNNSTPEIKNVESNPKIDDELSKELIDFFVVLSLISLYFSKFPYLYGYLNYEEIEKILSEEVTLENLRFSYSFHVKYDLYFLYVKLNIENDSILDEKVFLHNLQSFLIKFLRFTMIEKGYQQYPTLIKYLMDIDFCLKIFFACIYRFSFFKNDGLKAEFDSAINEVEGKRLSIYLVYCNMNKDFIKEKALTLISQNDFNTLNKALQINDFIILGDEKFYNKIKKIESFAEKKLPFLSISQVREFLEFKKKSQFRNFTYFLITSADEAQNMFKEIYSIKNEYALYLILIIYIDDKKNTLVNKIPFQMQESLPIFIANNVNEIINYVKSQENLNCGFDFINLSEDIMNRIQKDIKIDFLKDENNEKNDITIEDGWELVENIPEDYFQKLVYLGEEEGKESYFAPDLLRSNILAIFKSNKIESLLYDIYCKYFNFNLYPELEHSNSLISVPIKQFCYAYTLSDKNSLYYKMNEELRYGDSSLIEKYLRFIVMINIGVKDKYVKSYKGQLFRATSIKKEIIDKNFIVGKNLINLCFMSSSKSLEKAESYLADPWRNTLFIIETIGNNIDIDEEKISKFEDEKEVLFLPFSKFFIVSKEEKIFMDKTIYEIKLKGMDNENERGKIKSSFAPSQVIEKLYD